MAQAEADEAKPAERRAPARRKGARAAHPLGAYEAKRDFTASPEPRGRRARAKGFRFVVQKHAARRLHYDFRLELDGVLKSWAVTRGPSLVVGEKRLAVETEDHPLSYLDFEGLIPKGQYGGGSVIVWDIGTWQPEGDPRTAYAEGKLSFTLHGERLNGRWHLVRTRPRGGKTQWLMLKAQDEEARPPGAPDILGAETSVLSGRSNADLEARGVLRTDHAAREAVARGGKARHVAPAGAKPGLLPVFVEPCLATLAGKAPNAPGWLHEIKFDGYRLQARIDGRDVKLLTRSGLDWTEKFASLAKLLRGLKLPSALLDGELVVEDAAGLSDFSALQADLKAGRADRLVLYLFDLLYLDGRDLRPLRLGDRKAALAELLAEHNTGGALRFSDHVEEDGEAMARHACRLGLEGIVSKRIDRPYRSGRGGDWLKIKCTARQEAVIAGFAPSSVARKAVGSLVLGVHDKGKLVHIGRAGTGFTADVARDLWTRLEPLCRPDPPFAGRLTPEAGRGGVVWVEPQLVAEVDMRGWTGDGHVRHAAFKGLREDKAAEDVRREEPMTSKASSRHRPADDAVPRLTHPDRVLWDDVGLTKQGLAEFYTEIADWILPQIVGRPLSLVRGPDGASHKTFFQKHAWAGLDERLVQPIRLGEDDALTIRDLPGLLALVQASVLEIHPWGCRIEDAERPDRLVFDLDPSEGVGWPDVVAAAVTVRERLQAVGHEGFLKTTGGKGLHVVVPLKPRASWDEAKAFAQGIAAAMARDEPKRFTATLSKRARTGRIFVDYLRNGRGATAVAAYSTRARAGAPVATPLSWEEVGDVPSGSFFTVDTIVRRLDGSASGASTKASTDGSADPWAEMERAARPLEPARPRRRKI